MQTPSPKPHREHKMPRKMPKYAVAAMGKDHCGSNAVLAAAGLQPPAVRALLASRKASGPHAGVIAVATKAGPVLRWEIGTVPTVISRLVSGKLLGRFALECYIEDQPFMRHCIAVCSEGDHAYVFDPSPPPDTPHFLALTLATFRRLGVAMVVDYISIL